MSRRPFGPPGGRRAPERDRGGAVDRPGVGFSMWARAPRVFAGLGLGAVYVLGVGSVLFAPEGSDVAVWWPAAGLSVAILLLSPRRWRTHLAVGVVLASALANYTAGRAPLTALAFGLSNAAEAYVVAWLLTRGRPGPAALRTMEDLRRLAVATLLGISVVGAGIGTIVALWLDGSFLTAAASVMASHAAAILVFTPLALRVGGVSLAGHGKEALAQFLLLLGAVAYVFAPGHGLSLSFLPLPVLLWGSMRFGLRMVSYELVLLGVATTTLTVAGGGPFAVGTSTGVATAATTALLVQSFLIVTALIALPLGVAVDQRRTALTQVSQSEELFRKSFSESFVGMVLLCLSSDGLRIREHNQKAAEILADSRGHLEGRSLQSLFRTETRFVEVAERIQSGELGGWREEMWLVDQPGRRIGLALSPLSTSAQEAMFSAQLIDITDVHVATTKLRAEKDFTAAVLNTTDCLIAVADLDGKIAGANPAVEQASGYTEAELCERTLWDDLFSAEDRDAVCDLLDHTRPRTTKPTFEGDLHTSRGHRRRVIWSSAPLTGDEGHQTHAVLTGIDVTDERNVRSMTKHLLDSATATAIICLDRTGLVTIFNGGAQELLGYTAEEVTGRLRLDALHDRVELLEAAREAGTAPGFAAIAVGVEQEPQTRDWTYLRKDGSRVVCSVTLSAVRDAFGSHIGYLAVGRDVTESRRSRQILVQNLEKERQALERLRDLDQAKSDFVSMVSHELRTPITSIVGYTEMLQEGAAGAVSLEQDRLLDAVRRNGERLIALIEDLLTLSRIEAGTFTLEKSHLDLCRVLARAEEALQPLLTGRRLVVRFVAPAEPVVVLGDPAQLERVVLNLVGNAVKFTEDGGDVCCTLSTRGGLADLTVTDSGIGIPEDEQANLFTRFFRSSTAQERAIKGTGLGLTIVASIVDSHGGEIAIRSEHLVGTEASVQLPLVPAPDRVDAAV